PGTTMRRRIAPDQTLPFGPAGTAGRGLCWLIPETDNAAMAHAQPLQIRRTHLLLYADPQDRRQPAVPVCLSAGLPVAGRASRRGAGAVRGGGRAVLRLQHLLP